jgi:hypothetical protein
MNERIVFGGVELWDVGLAKILELDFATHELAHVILKGFGTEGHLSRKRVHASGRAGEEGTGRSRRRRIEEWSRGNGVRGAPEASRGSRGSVAAGWANVDWQSAESRSGDGGGGGRTDIGIGRNWVRGGNGYAGDGGGVDMIRCVDDGRRALAGTMGSAPMETVGGNGGFGWPGDVNVGEQKTDQNRDLDGAGWARTIQEALDD